MQCTQCSQVSTTLFTKKIECLIHLNNTIVILPSIAPIHQYLGSQQSVIRFFFCLPSFVNMFSNNTWAGFTSLCLYITFSQSLFSHRHCKMCSCSDHLPSPIIFHLSLSFARLPTTANDTLQRCCHQQSVFSRHCHDVLSPLQQILVLFPIYLTPLYAFTFSPFLLALSSVFNKM